MPDQIKEFLLSGRRKISEITPDQIKEFLLFGQRPTSDQMKEFLLNGRRTMPDQIKEFLLNDRTTRSDQMKEFLSNGQMITTDQIKGILDHGVALPSEGPEEIPDKSEISSIRNFQPASGACLGKTMLDEENQHQQGGPHQCQVDVRRFSPSQKASGASLGRTMPLRTLSLKPITDITEIWNEAERRLETDRSNFSLVYEGSHYLPTSGFLPKPTQLFEIRWQGRGGKPKAIVQKKLSIEWYGLHTGLILWADTVDQAIRKWAKSKGFKLSPENRIIGGYYSDQKFERPTNITVKDFFEGIDIRNWGFYIEGRTWEDNFYLPEEETVRTPEEEEIVEESLDSGLVDTGNLPWMIRKIEE
jgi:hypothetical protein